MCLERLQTQLDPNHQRSFCHQQIATLSDCHTNNCNPLPHGGPPLQTVRREYVVWTTRKNHAPQTVRRECVVWTTRKNYAPQAVRRECLVRTTRKNHTPQAVRRECVVWTTRKNHAPQTVRREYVVWTTRKNHAPQAVSAWLEPWERTMLSCARISDFIKGRDDDLVGTFPLSTVNTKTFWLHLKCKSSVKILFRTFCALWGRLLVFRGQKVFADDQVSLCTKVCLLWVWVNSQTENTTLSAKMFFTESEKCQGLWVANCWKFFFSQL